MDSSTCVPDLGRTLFNQSVQFPDMKPQDLSYPFSWNARRPFLEGQVFYVPDYYEDHNRKFFPQLKAHFGNDHPVQIEYCSGNGEWILDKAQASPEINWIAVEKKFKRVRKIYSKMVNRGLKNILIVSGEALTFSKQYLPEEGLDRVFINFPDPWPKERHAKHRLIRKPFVQELNRTVKRHGSVTLVTDHPSYLEQMRFEMQEWTLETDSLKAYGSSYFERLWLSKGLKINHLHYVR